MCGRKERSRRVGRGDALNEMREYRAPENCCIGRARVDGSRDNADSRLRMVRCRVPPVTDGGGAPSHRSWGCPHPPLDIVGRCPYPPSVTVPPSTVQLWCPRAPFVKVPRPTDLSNCTYPGNLDALRCDRAERRESGTERVASAHDEFPLCSACSHQHRLVPVRWDCCRMRPAVVASGWPYRGLSGVQVRVETTMDQASFTDSAYHFGIVQSAEHGGATFGCGHSVVAMVRHYR